MDSNGKVAEYSSWLINHIRRDAADYVGAVKANMINIVNNKKVDVRWFKRFFRLSIIEASEQRFDMLERYFLLLIVGLQVFDKHFGVALEIVKLLPL